MKQYRDNIGVLRLVFASLVIVGHAPEMIDGSRKREILTQIFHTVSIGEVSVDAFFLLSGYLITSSWVRSQNARHYFERRILRIYPAFIVAYLLSAFCLGPLVGARPWQLLPQTLLQLMLLQPPPNYAGQLTGLAYPILNNSMWTIAYEFRCYILVAILGATGLLVRAKFILALTVFMAAGTVLCTFEAIRAPLGRLAAHQWVGFTFGNPWRIPRFTTAFLAGTCLYNYKEVLASRLTPGAAAVSAIVAIGLLYRDPHFAEISLIFFGGVSLFWLAFKADVGVFSNINKRWDISYGVYLYGWPVATAILWFDRGVSPWQLAALTLALALGCGAASWWGLERWTKNLTRSSPPRGVKDPSLVV